MSGIHIYPTPRCCFGIRRTCIWSHQLLVVGLDGRHGRRITTRHVEGWCTDLIDGGGHHDFFEGTVGAFRIAKQINGVLASLIGGQRNDYTIIENSQFIRLEVDGGFQGFECTARDQQGRLALHDCCLDGSYPATEMNGDTNGLFGHLFVAVTILEVVHLRKRLGDLHLAGFPQVFELLQCIPTNDGAATSGVQYSEPR